MMKPKFYIYFDFDFALFHYLHYYFISSIIFYDIHYK